ncbi:MAG: FAD-linked oxidase C-terminal domain-containing protein, partial [Chloroflexota bacterium]
VRKAGLGLLMSMKGNFKPVPFIEDAAVPVADLPDYVRQLETFCADLGTPITYYAHASAGCLHVRPLMDASMASDVAKMPLIAQFSADLVRGYGGAISSEHGDGRSRSWLNEAFYGPDLYELFKQVKQIFDPHALLNPGIIVDPQPMTDNMRWPALGGRDARVGFSDYLQPPANLPQELTAWQVDGPTQPGDTGLSRAINLCNGSGVCRQTAGGTMCPSFMVTRDEMHSTRGRANALRAAMSGLLPPEELTSPRMHGVMDLCISCKACKSECPSAVDMARLKMEFLERYHEANGISLRERFFGNVAQLNRLGSGRLAPLSNAALGNGVVRSVLNRTLGLAPRRKLPPLAEQTFESWFNQRPRRESAKQLVLLVDPFTNANYPEIGRAAVEFLETAGYGITMVAADEGRAFLSKGLLSEAREAADLTLEALMPCADSGLPIVGLEPSSLLTLRDEYLYLLGDDVRASRVAAQALTFEEFVAHEAVAGRLDVEFKREARRLLLHGHCHQKALIGTGPARAALSLPPGYTVEEVDSGCCGMAGSFGYEAEHYDVSMAMAERRLLPAVRSADEETIIVAAGVSCRQQIAHGSERTALHPAQVLRQALAES